MNGTHNYRILVIDDNRSIHEVFRKVLECPLDLCSFDESDWSLGSDFEEDAEDSYELVCCNQGELGVSTAEKAVSEGRPFAMAFVDMRMPPGWDGVKTVERLWKVDPLIQVAFMTAYSSYTLKEIQQKLGLPSKLLFLRKPFGAVEIQQTAIALTQKWSAERVAHKQNSHAPRFNILLDRADTGS